MNAHEHKRRLNRVWTWPMAIALVTAVGLISALLGDGWADAGAWVGMGLPTLYLAGIYKHLLP
jgi:hypothetical protein